MQKGKVKNIIKSDDLESTCIGLQELLQTSRRILARKTISVEELRECIEYVTEIRSLLAKWGQYEDKLRGEPDRISTITELKECYLELEGVVKELRNDLSGPR